MSYTTAKIAQNVRMAILYYLDFIFELEKMNTKLPWMLVLNSLCPQMCPCVIIHTSPTLRKQLSCQPISHHLESL